MTEPLPPEDEIARLRRRLEREVRARTEAEGLLEAKSAELFNALEQVRLEAAQGRQQLAAIEAAQDGLAIAGADGAFVYMNTAHETMFGYGPGELIGQPWSVLYDERELDRFDREVMPQFGKSGFWRGEAVGRDKSGAPVYQEVVLTGLETGGLICATRDISDRKRRDQQARQLAERLRIVERDAALFTLSSSIAHDFNNLLFAIKGHLHLLAGAVEATERSDQLFARLNDSVKSASDIVRSLSRFRGADMEASAPFDLAGLVARTVEIASPLQPDNVALNVDLPDSQMVTASELLVSRCVMNLLKNAFEATPGGCVVSVRLSHKRSAPFHAEASKKVLGSPAERFDCVLEIEDCGAGIASDQFDHVFEPFFTTKQDGKGAGLGLNTLSLVVESSPVWILVETLEGAGTRFSLCFKSENLPEKRAEPITDQTAAPGAPNILLVDDDETVGALIAKALSSLGHQVSYQPNPQLAIAMLASGEDRIDLLMTDLNMPAMRGDALARAATDLAPGLVCVGFSGQADFMAPDPVFSAFLRKPMDAEDLDDAIVTAMRTRAP